VVRALVRLTGVRASAGALVVAAPVAGFAPALARAIMCDPMARVGRCAAVCTLLAACASRAPGSLPSSDASAPTAIDAGATIDVAVGPDLHLDLDAQAPPVDAMASSVPACPDGGHTTISGTAFAPNGTLPLYNAIVYTPSEPLQPLDHGATCEQCGALNSAKASTTTLSDAHGHFVLVDPPTGPGVRLAVQVGKWRREVVLPNVTACVDNPLYDADYTRLPTTRTEGEMPRIAVTTGGADHIACMLPKIGVDSSEFGVDGTTAVTFYAGGGGSGPPGIRPAQTLWNDASAMMQYDMLVFSCEGSEEIGPLDAGLGGYGTKNSASFAAMTAYLAAGGRIFGTDFMYTVWKDSSDPNLADAATIPGGAPSGADLIDIDTSFPKGKALADWLSWLYPAQAYGTATLDVVYDNVRAANPAETQVWGRSADGLGHPRFMTVNTPAGAPIAQQCGKAVHLDAHVNQMDSVSSTYPAGCTSPFSAAEKAFAFFFFDLASCIQIESAPPQPPPPTKPPPM